MHRPETPSTRGGSAVPLLLAFVLASVAIAVLSLLTLGFVGVILALGFALAAFIASQYLLWGWWLGPLIRRQEAASEHDDAEQQQAE